MPVSDLVYKGARTAPSVRCAPTPRRRASLPARRAPTTRSAPTAPTGPTSARGATSADLPALPASAETVALYVASRASGVGRAPAAEGVDAHAASRRHQPGAQDGRAREPGAAQPRAAALGLGRHRAHEGHSAREGGADAYGRRRRDGRALHLRWRGRRHRRRRPSCAPRPGALARRLRRRAPPIRARRHPDGAPGLWAGRRAAAHPSEQGRPGRRGSDGRHRVRQPRRDVPRARAPGVPARLDGRDRRAA